MRSRSTCQLSWQWQTGVPIPPVHPQGSTGRAHWRREVQALITKKTRGKSKPSAMHLANSIRQTSLPRRSQDSFLAKIQALTLTPTWLSDFFSWDDDASHCQRKGFMQGCSRPCWTLEPFNGPNHRTTRQACYLQSAPPLEKHAIFQR